MIGRTLDGFRVVALLGRGGMGEVWKAEQLALGGRPVALKLLRADRADVERAVARLRREGVLAASVKHPGIAQIYAAGEVDGLHYVAMELVEGETLAARLARGALAPLEARRITRAVAEALAHAHARGVLHRDVTTGNVMLEPEGRVVLLDFGLALGADSSRLTSQDAIAGTPEFIAPEVLRGFEPDARSDVYSLGVVLDRMLTGASPFAALHPAERLRAALDAAPPPPSQRRPGLSPAWDALVLRALAREPGLRFASARELIDALDALGEADLAPLHAPVADEHASTQEMPAPARGGGPRRLAVMPFADLGGTPEGAAFADGFSDALGVALARHPGLRVVPAISTRELVREGLRRVAREFDVEYVLTGTVQRAGTSLRVSLALVDAQSGRPATAETLQGELDELPALEAQCVRSIEAGLRIEPQASLARAALPTPVAQERLLQARGYLQRGDSEAAVDGALKLLEALAADANAGADVWTTLASACRIKFTHTRERAWVERGLRAAERAHALAPGDADAKTELARLHVAVGRPAEAEREFRDVLASRPEHLAARIGMADLLRQQGRLREAEAVSRQATAIRPDAWGAFNQLGAILFDLARHEEAIEAWRHVARLTPDNPRADLNIGAALVSLGRYEEAEQAIRRSLALRPTSAGLTSLAAVRFALGDLEGAADASERAVGLSETVPVMWGNLGSALRWLPDASARARAAFDRAVQLAREQLALNPHDAALRADLAMWLACRGDFDEARREVERALAEDPGSGEIALHAACVFELSGERARALELVEHAVECGYGWGLIEGERDLERLRASEGYRQLESRHRPAPESGAFPPDHDPRPEGER